MVGHRQGIVRRRPQADIVILQQSLAGIVQERRHGHASCRGEFIVWRRLLVHPDLIRVAFGLFVVWISRFIMAQMPNVSLDAALAWSVLRHRSEERSR